MTPIISRIEAASGGDRELFEAAYEAIYGRTWPATVYFHGALGADPDYEKGQAAQRFGELVGMGAWLDAAMTLIPTDGSMTLVDLVLSWEASDQEVYPACTVRWYPPAKSFPNWHAQIASGATPALALCAAALKSREPSA